MLPVISPVVIPLLAAFAPHILFGFRFFNSEKSLYLGQFTKTHLKMKSRKENQLFNLKNTPKNTPFSDLKNLGDKRIYCYLISVVVLKARCMIYE